MSARSWGCRMEQRQWSYEICAGNPLCAINVTSQSQGWDRAQEWILLFPGEVGEHFSAKGRR